jgi:chorismate-pyruvate lyase
MRIQHAQSTTNKKGFTYEFTSFGKAFINFASKSSKPVMDIGAAYGVATLPAVLRGATVLAVDVERQHLESIRESLHPSLLPHLKILCKRFPDFDMPSESVGAVYMSQVLPFLTGEEIMQGARKIYDWLIPGGEVFVVSFTPYISHVKSFISVYESRKLEGIRWPGYIRDLSRYSDDPNIYNHLPNQINHIDADDLKYAFETAGFRIKELRCFGEEEGPLPGGIRYDGRERVGMIAYKPVGRETSLTNTYWEQISPDIAQRIPESIREWLCKPFVLSKALRRVCDNFAVEISDQRIKYLYADEISALKCYDQETGYIRETYLGETGNPLVYARVTMPEVTYLANRTALDNLGNKPIGETLLYNDPSMTRSVFEVKKLTQDDELLFDAIVHENFYRYFIEKTVSNDLWARRSVFTISGNPLLITEVFMPDIPRFVASTA